MAGQAPEIQRRARLHCLKHRLQLTDRPCQRVVHEDEFLIFCQCLPTDGEQCLPVSPHIKAGVVPLYAARAGLAHPHPVRRGQRTVCNKDDLAIFLHCLHGNAAGSVNTARRVIMIHSIIKRIDEMGQEYGHTADSFKPI